MKKHGKKGLSLFLALLMCLTVFVLDWSGFIQVSPEADAASAGQYEFRIAVNSSNNTGGWKSEKMTVYGKETNGTGTEVQMKQATNWYVDFNGWRYNTFGLQGSGDKESDTCPGFTMNQFPTKVVYEFTIESAWADRNLEFNLYIQVKKSDGTWVSLPVSQSHTSSGQASAEGDCSGTKVHYKINSSFTLKNGSGTVTFTVSSSGYPKASSIAAGTGFANKTVVAKQTGGGSVTTTAAAVVKDQYGVNWYQTPIWSISSNSWGTSSAAHASLTGTSGADSTTVTINETWRNAAPGVITVKAERGDANKTFNITVTPTYKISYDSTYNYGKDSFTQVTSPVTETNTGTSTTITLNSKSGFAAVKNNTTTSGKGEGQQNTGTWTFVGWNTSNTAHNGTKSGNISGIGYNQTLYAIYSKAVKATYYYYDANGNIKSGSNTQTAYNKDTKVTFQFPDLSGSSFTANGTTYTFAGWVRDELAAKAPDFTGTTDERFVNNDGYTYYAIYTGKVTLSYDVNSVSPNRVTSPASLPTQTSATQYLAALASEARNATRNAMTFTVNNTQLTRPGMTEFRGWRIKTANTDPEREDGVIDAVPGGTFSIKENTTLIAVFRDKRVTVNFINHVGGIIKADQVRYDYPAIAPVDPPFSNTENPDHTDDNNHYVFDYWRYADDSRYQSADVFLADADIFAVYASHKHVWDKERDQIANCTSNAIFDANCTVCGYHINEVIPAKGHDWMLDGRVEPTCLRAGNSGKAVCRACGNTDYTQYFVKTEDGYIIADAETEGAFLADGHVLEPAGHKWIEEDGEVKIFVNEGTCTVAGYKYKKCEVCDTEEITERLGMQPHGYSQGLETVQAVPATCTTDGHNEYSVCKDCGAYTAQPVVIPAKGHALKHFVAVPATCLMEGNLEYWYCANCGKYFTDAAATAETTAEEVKLDKVPHTYVETEAEDATCTTPGHTAGIVCSVCGDIPEGSSASETTPALGHVWEREGFAGYETLTVVDTKEATCTEKGYTEYQCSECDATVKVETDMIAHSLNHMEAKAATCQEEGNIEAWHCAVCDKYFEDEAGTVEIDASRVILGKTDHTWVAVEGSEAKEPTCTEDGYTAEMECSVCGESKASETIPATGHVRTDWIEVQPATCTEAGREILVCRACRETIDERTIPAKEHTIEEVEAKAATCVTDGNTAGAVCTVCGFIPEGSAYTVIPANGEHNFVVISEMEATCGHVGKKFESCSVCGEARVTETPKAEHPEDQIVDVVPAKDATCTAMGITAGKKCAVCGEIIELPQPVAKIPHTPENVADVPATCISKGKTGVVVCSVCGKTINSGTTTDMLRHDWSDWARTEPTCTEPGKSVRTCNLCQKEDKIVIPALGHQVVTDAAVAPTCTAVGLTEGSHCSRCNTILTAQQEVAALGHSYDVTVTAPTCTAEGYTTHTCVLGDDSYVDATVDALGHDWVADASRNIAPTCQETGSNAFVCSRCGDRKRETVDKADHIWGNAVYTAATCTENGYWTYTCTFGCGETRVEETDPATGHHYENGVCTVCGAEDPNYSPDTPDTPDTPSTPSGSEKCSKCGLNHNGRTSLWREDGFFCRIIAFFRNIFKMFSR